MRGTLTILVVLAGTAADARPAPRRMPPPFERNCTSVESSEKLAQCIETHAKGAQVTKLGSDLQRVSTREARQYLFVQFGERWQMVYRPGDENYELVGRSEMKVGTETARRIDLGHHVVLGNTGVFFERVSLVCQGQRCSAFTTACTVIQRGRAVETFRGVLSANADGALSLDGDRSHATSICGNR